MRRLHSLPTLAPSASLATLSSSLFTRRCGITTTTTTAAIVQSSFFVKQQPLSLVASFSSSFATSSAPLLQQQLRFASAGSFFRSQTVSGGSGGSSSKPDRQQSTSSSSATTAQESTTKASTNDKGIDKGIDEDNVKGKNAKSFEQLFEKTKIAFASAASNELVPSTAASEAYDLALTALRAATGNPELIPNLCFTVISVDHEGMIDAPQVVWKNFSQDIDLTRSNPITNPQEAAKLKNRLMLGTIVRNQRVGDGFVEVMLGYIPDLRYTAFTFDKVPKNVQEYIQLLHQDQQQQQKQQQRGTAAIKDLPPVVAGFVFSDWRIGGRHPVALADRIAATNNVMMNFNREQQLQQQQQQKGANNTTKKFPPLVGAVLPPAESFHVQMKNQQLRDEQQQQEQQQQAPQKIPKDEDVAPSLFFVNDDVYRGSAGAVILHSNLVDAHVSTLTPPVIIKTNVTIDEGAIDESIAVWKINRLGGKSACDFVREMYETDEGLKKRKFSKMFLGLAHPKLKDQPFPLSFVGHPNEGGHITIVLPAFLRDAAVAAKTLTLLRDDDAFESELIGQDLIQFEKTQLLTKTAAETGGDGDDEESDHQHQQHHSASFALDKNESEGNNFANKVERVRVHRERNADIVVANACGLHFSHPLLYTIFKREKNLDDGLLTMGGGSLEKHAPSVLRRVLGTELPNSGLHASGILIPFNDEEIPPQMLPRASAHLMFTPKKN